MISIKKKYLYWNLVIVYSLCPHILGQDIPSTPVEDISSKPEWLLDYDASFMVVVLHDESMDQAESSLIADQTRIEVDKARNVAMDDFGGLILTFLDPDLKPCPDLDCASQLGSELYSDLVVAIEMDRKVYSVKKNERFFTGKVKLYLVSSEDGKVLNEATGYHRGTSDELLHLSRLLVWELLEVDPPEGRFDDELLLTMNRGLSFRLYSWVVANPLLAVGFGALSFTTVWALAEASKTPVTVYGEPPDFADIP